MSNFEFRTNQKLIEKKILKSILTFLCHLLLRPLDFLLKESLEITDKY